MMGAPRDKSRAYDRLALAAQVLLLAFGANKNIKNSEGYQARNTHTSNCSTVLVVREQKMLLLLKIPSLGVGVWILSSSKSPLWGLGAVDG